MSRLALVLRKYGVVATVSTRNRLAYLASYFSGFLSYALFIFVFSRIWSEVYASRAEIAGYDRAMSTWYFIAAELPLFVFGRFFFRLADDLKDGQIAYQLARPYGYVAYSFAERMGPALLDLALYAAIGCALGFALAGPPPLLATAGLGGVPGAAPVVAPKLGLAAVGTLAFLSSLFLSGCLTFFLQISLAMTAFWIEENTAFFWIYQKLALVVGTLVPLEFLPDSARALAAWTPFPSIAWAPARMLVAFDPALAPRMLTTQAAWLVFALVLARAVFAAGRRRVVVNGG